MLSTNDFLEIIKNDKSSNSLFYGTITDDLKVLFDGETAASKKTFACVNYTPTSGDRVVLLKQGQIYIILGAVTDSISSTLNNVDLGDDTISFDYTDGSHSIYNLTKDDQGRVISFDGVKINYSNTSIPPNFGNAYVNNDGKSIVIVFDRLMINPTHHESEFSVDINGNLATITSTSQGDHSNEIVLNLYETIITSDTVRVKYTGTTVTSFQNIPLAIFDWKTVTNDSVDSPQYISAVTNNDGSIITVTFDKAMANPAAEYQQFDVVGVINGVTSDKFPWSAALNTDPTKIDITVYITIKQGETVTIDYNIGGLKSADGAYLQSFTGKSVSNISTAEIDKPWKTPLPSNPEDLPLTTIFQGDNGIIWCVYSTKPIYEDIMGFAHQDSDFIRKYTSTYGGDWTNYWSGTVVDSIPSNIVLTNKILGVNYNIMQASNVVFASNI